MLRSKGTTEEKLEKLATTIYEGGRQFGFGVENREKKSSVNHMSRRQNRIKEVKKEKKRL